MAKPAYMIIAIDTHDAAVLDTYRDQAMPLLQEFGAELIAATDDFELTDGAWPRKRIVLSGASIPHAGSHPDGGNEYQCGGCGAVLVTDSLPWEVRNIVFRCSDCSAPNLHPDSSLITE